jgi:pimeloyl-ACP methyl ester carboxylesterase
VKMAQRFHDELPGSELVVFEEAGHFVWEDEAPRAVQMLVEFLARRVADETGVAPSRERGVS